jgi:hypothetical protein
MKHRLRTHFNMFVVVMCALAAACNVHAADAPLGGFIPLVGLGLTREYDDLDDEATFFLADQQNSFVGQPMGPFVTNPPTTPYFDFAIFDTGAATHVLTNSAANNNHFAVAKSYTGNTDGFAGTNFQTLFGASGPIELRINDPLGVYIAGLADGSSSGSTLTMNTGALRGQSSVAMLQSMDDTEWTLPNIIGLPMAAQHAIAIRNSEPVIFQHDFDDTAAQNVRTVRTPNIDLIPRGQGAAEGILRQVELKLRPSIGFIQGPLYVQGGDIFSLELHENPASPTVVENGGLFVEVDLAKGGELLEDRELLFDTAAELTVISRNTARKLGFDAILDQPDYLLEVESPGGVSSGVPVIHIDELSLDTIGGSFTLQNVPVMVLDLPNPNDPGNVVAGILGMNVFTGRDVVIDANPAAGGNSGGPPTLFIGDPVAQTHNWSVTASSAPWVADGSWSGTGTPNVMWDAIAANVSGSDQRAVISTNSTVYRTTISGTPTAGMAVQINTSATLTVFSETLIKQGGRIDLVGGNLDALFVNIEGGTLAGEGEVSVGAGPNVGQVRNLTGRVEPGLPIGELTIDGDYSQQATATLAIDLSGATQSTQYDHLLVDRYAFLNGTLEVNLLSFAPADNTSFTILTAEEGIFGAFDNLLLPSAYDWEITYGANDVILTVLGAATNVPGDFNDDGAVNAADYVWLQKVGTPADKVTWRTHFGESQTGLSASIPEPSTSMLALFAACGLAYARRRNHCRLTRAAPFATSIALRWSCYR